MLRRKTSTTGTDPAVYYCANNVNVYTALDDAAGCSAPVTQAFTYDADGNMLSDGAMTYVWDRENRLAEAREAAPVEGSRKVVFGYDYMSRRVRRQVFTYDAAVEAWRTTAEEDVRFVYDGWNVILELDGMDDLAVIRRYTWGMDLSGTRQGAGGIGGLLGIHDAAASKDYLVFYDANGNVGQLVDISDGSLAARYEYDAYGNTLVTDGPYAASNPFRFSTKYFDAETGLYYYGYRYYRPDLGRWMNRDPILEQGGINPLAYCDNQSTSRYDSLGLLSSTECKSARDEALESATVKELFEKASSGRDSLGIACLGNIRCICCIWPGISGGYNPLTRDIYLCQNRLTSSDVKTLVHHELVHAVSVCGWWKLGCKNCMIEEKRAYYMAGQCRTDLQCTRRAFESCKSSLSCSGLFDKPENHLGEGWPPAQLPNRESLAAPDFPPANSGSMQRSPSYSPQHILIP